MLLFIVMISTINTAPLNVIYLFIVTFQNTTLHSSKNSLRRVISVSPELIIFLSIYGVGIFLISYTLTVKFLRGGFDEND